MPLIASDDFEFQADDGPDLTVAHHCTGGAKVSVAEKTKKEHSTHKG